MAMRRCALAALAAALLAACQAPDVHAPVPADTALRHVQRVPIVIPKWNMDEFGRSGCYPVGAEQVKLGVQTVDSTDVADWRRQLEAVSTECDRTAPADGKWYYDALPENGYRTLLVYWKNVSTGAYDFVAIQYTSGGWTVTTNNGSPASLGSGRRRMFHFKTNGQSISIEVEDMPDEGAWAPNEIKWRITR